VMHFHITECPADVPFGRWPMKTECEIIDGSPCDYLKWDSDFFGRRIGRVHGRFSPGDIGRILEWCEIERIDCLYLLAASDDAQAVAVAEKHGFHLVDIRITLEVALEPISKEAGGTLRLARPSDLEALKQIGSSSFRDSRFYYDPRFEKTRCDDLYATWIEESCKLAADFVLVAEDEGQPAGFVTCHAGPGDAGSIGLIAVSAAHQSRGLGRRLVTSALHSFHQRGLRFATVVTQGRNIRSQRLYQKCGFVSRSVELWYHRWSAWSILEE
jgi:dTDP-4-amino-4,6-dideoxy-D-galactose acyltransferase